METIIPSIITGAVAIVTCLITTYFQHNRTINLIAYRLGELEKKVDKHNNVIERTYELERNTAIQDEKNKVVNNRIKDLEDEMEKVRT